MTLRTRHILGLALLANVSLAACTTALTPTQQTAVQAVTTLASVAAASNQTVATAVAKGQAFCQTANGIVALMADLTSTTSVVGQTDRVVTAACAAIQGVPHAQPTNIPQDSVPVVVSAAAAGLKAP
jgi:hypothetical protein